MKIILAIDLYETEIQKDPLIYKELNRWCENAKTDVQPVFIHSTTLEEEMILDHLPHTGSNFDFTLLAPFADLKVLHMPGATRKKEIEALLSYAKEQQADLIALVSQGKATVEKKLLGSFAESLLLKSEMPLLFLEEEVRIKSNLDKVLFATDFSEASTEAFSLFLKHMNQAKPEIVLFNAIQLPQFRAAGPVYSHAMQVLPQNYWEEQRQWAETQGKALVEIAEARGFQVRLEISNQVFSIETSIHEIVRREKVKLVAMVSVSSLMQRLLLGSVSRSILRNRIKPIWICGPLCLGHK
jgi:nucleotide-binding universal stress UspA family protein